jgi:hypothetical protein
LSWGPGHGVSRTGCPTKLRNQSGALVVEVLCAPDVVVGAGGGEVLVEFGKASSVGDAGGGIEEGS